MVCVRFSEEMVTLKPLSVPTRIYLVQLGGGQKVVGVGRDDEHVTLHLAHVQVALHTAALLHAVLPLLDEAVPLALPLTCSLCTHLRCCLLDLIHVPVLVLIGAKQGRAVVAALSLLARAEAVTTGCLYRLCGFVVMLRSFQYFLLGGDSDGDLE